MLNVLWSGFLGSRRDTKERDQEQSRLQETLQMELVVNRYAQAVAGAMATSEEVETYEFARKRLVALKDAPDEAQGLELAEEVRPLFQKLGEELGI